MFVYLIFWQNIRDEGKGRAMAVGTETAVATEFSEGFRVAKVFIDSHLLWEESIIFSFCHYRSLLQLWGRRRSVFLFLFK